MELEKGELAPSPASETRALSVFRLVLLFSLLGSLIWLVSCAAPGEPIERKPQVPTAITDLAAQQQGNDVILTFTLPKDTVDHRPLKKTPAIEVYRGFDPPAAATTGTQEPLFLILTIPPAMVANYSEKNRIRVIELARFQRFVSARGLDGVVHSPHTRIREKRISGFESRLCACLPSARSHPGSSCGSGAQRHPSYLDSATTDNCRPYTLNRYSIAAYHIYRAETAPELQPSTPPAASGVVSGVPKLKVPLARIGESTEPTFQDRQVEFGKTYVYSVRSLVQYSDVAVESADSNLVIATPRAIFPPEAPQNLTVVLVPAQGENSAYLDLSWAISAETDIAGYNVYRSEQDGVPGRRLNSELLLTPAFRDMNAVPGHQYVYTATAVDRAGNESPASASASGSIPVEGQPRP